MIARPSGRVARRNPPAAARAAAHALRTAGSVDGVVRLPAVMPSSGASAVSAMISRTCSAGTPSSSAAAWVICAREPWPPSTLPVMTVIDAVGADVQPRVER